MAELPNLKWQVNVLVSALEKLGCSSTSASALLSAPTSHVGHSGHMPEDARGMEAVMPLPQSLGGTLPDVGLAHHAAIIPQHLNGLPLTHTSRPAFRIPSCRLSASMLQLSSLFRLDHIDNFGNQNLCAGMY